MKVRHEYAMPRFASAITRRGEPSIKSTACGRSSSAWCAARKGFTLNAADLRCMNLKITSENLDLFYNFFEGRPKNCFSKNSAY